MNRVSSAWNTTSGRSSPSHTSLCNITKIQSSVFSDKGIDIYLCNNLLHVLNIFWLLFDRGLVVAFIDQSDCEPIQRIWSSH